MPGRQIDHDDFVRRNASNAKPYELEEKDKILEKSGGDILIAEPTCFNCRKQKHCYLFRKMRTGGEVKSVSIDSGKNKFWCKDHKPEKNKNRMDKRGVKNLLKKAMSGRL